MIQLDEDGREPSFSFPDMTALLDVIFILLVFLLLALNVPIKHIELDLPSVEKQTNVSQMERHQLVISIGREPHIWGINQEQYTEWQVFASVLGDKLKALNNGNGKKMDIVIAGDKDASLEKTLKLISFLRDHNATAAQILVGPAGSK